MRTKLNRPLAALLCLAASALPACAQGHTCARMELTGQVDAGREWRAAIGEGWVFRVLPVQGGAYSGWDLVVDRDPAAVYPDALLLATPPYNSISEREIGTTFGLRAQDALGWNPRSFHFLVDPAAFAAGQKLFAQLSRADAAADSPARIAALTRALMALEGHAAAGQFRILDARIAPGTADSASFAQNWGIAAERVQHTNEPPAHGQATPRGEFHWIRFSITLWLPAQWKAPPGVAAKKGPCG